MPRSLEEWWTFSRILQVYATHSPSPFHLWRWSYRNTWTSTCKFFEILRSSFLCSCLYVDFFFFLFDFIYLKMPLFFREWWKVKLFWKFSRFEVDIRVILSILKKKWKKEKGRFKINFFIILQQRQLRWILHRHVPNMLSLQFPFTSYAVTRNYLYN